MEYYIIVNNERRGPYTIDHLKTMQLTPSTMVWCKGMANWAPAQEVTELNCLFTPTNDIPPMPQTPPTPPTYTQPEPMYEYEEEPERKKAFSSTEIIVASAVALVIALLVAAFAFNIIDFGRGGGATDEDIVLTPSLENPKWDSSVSESQKQVISGLLKNMVKVPNGVFAMGTKCSARSMSSYYIGKYEITQSEWEAVMGTTVSAQRSLHSGDRLAGIGDNLPMYFVNQSEAKRFCEELSRKTGLVFNLPTEEQWEYAAKGAGNDNTRYSGSNNVYEVAWCGEPYAYGNVHQVGSLSPNSLGLYDMSGNVWEWCRETAIIRGGCILHDESKCKVTWRWSEPNFHKGFNRGGFRIVME